MAKPINWDPEKAAANRRNHGVAFEEAQTVFDNPFAVIFNDEAHSDTESREILIGHSANNRLLLVVFVEHVQHIRLISARTATTKEQREYEQGAGYFSNPR